RHAAGPDQRRPARPVAPRVEDAPRPAAARPRRRPRRVNEREAMSDHAWVQEHIATAVAGGLTADEAERLDAHVRDCPACAAALAEARTLDRGLGSLFAPVRPGPELEDEVIGALRATRARRRLLEGWT